MHSFNEIGIVLKELCIFELLLKKQFKLSKTYRITICMGSSCFSRGNKEILERIREFIARHHLTDRVILKGSHCLGNCSNGPSMVVNDRLVSPLSLSTIDAILEKALKTG